MKFRLATIFSLLAIVLMSFTGSAQDKDAKGAVGPVKLSGLMFGDFYYNVDQIKTENKDVNGLQFRRIYVTADYTINSNFSSRFRLESDQSDPASKIGVMVKDAYLKWKNIFNGSNLVAGISPTPAFAASEKIWGYRSLEKTSMDYFKIVSSRDMGIDLMGKLDEKGTASYWVKLGNNTGNKPESNKYKRYYAQFQYKPNSNIVMTVYGDYASHGQVLDAFDNEMKDNSAFVAAGFLGYKEDKKYSIGVEAFMKSQQNNYAMENSALATQSGMGISAFAWLALVENIRLVGRFDTFDPNTEADIKDDSETLLIAAVDFRVADNVSIMPGVLMHTKEGADDNDLVPRVSFLWVF